MRLESKPDVKFAALVLVEVAYRKKLIDKATYQAVIKKYGGTFYEKRYYLYESKRT